MAYYITPIAYPFTVNYPFHVGRSFFSISYSNLFSAFCIYNYDTFIVYLIVYFQILQLLWQGVDEFNKKAKKGIEFLQENNLISNPLVPAELVQFFKDNQKVDKKVIGEYIGSRNNGKVLDAFVR